MKVNPRAERLVNEFVEVLIDNDLMVVEKCNIVWTDQKWLEVKPLPQSADANAAIKASVEAIHAHILRNRTLVWLRELKRNTENDVRLQKAADDRMEAKKVAQFEAYRNRVMVKGVRAGQDDSKIFTAVAGTDKESVLRFAEYFFDGFERFPQNDWNRQTLRDLAPQRETSNS